MKLVGWFYHPDGYYIVYLLTSCAPEGLAYVSDRLFTFEVAKNEATDLAIEKVAMAIEDAIIVAAEQLP